MSVSRSLVSVVIPVFNRSDLLGETLASVCGQSYDSLEILVVDDGSTDGTQDVIASWRHRDPRILQVVREAAPHRGAGAARNAGFNASQGRFVLFLDSDDLLSSSCIAQRVEMLEADESCDLSVGQALIFDTEPGDQRILWNHVSFSAQDLIQRFLRQDMPWANGGALWRRSSLQRIGPWAEDLASFQDWEFHLRACLMGCRVSMIAQPDFYVRRATDADRVSLRHFDIAHVAARAKAFARINALTHTNRTDNKTYRPHLRGFVIRNQLQLIEHGHTELVSVFLTNVGENPLTFTDEALLAWAKRIGTQWRGSAAFRKARAAFWADVPYDSYVVSSVMTSQWHGALPVVSQCS